MPNPDTPPAPDVSKTNLLKQSKVFCMLPWVHMYVHANGNAFPCCISKDAASIGNLGESTFREVWNSTEMRLLRRNMLDGRESPGCAQCYERDRVNYPSFRQTSNSSYTHHFNLVDTTLPDGTLPTFHMPYLDIRFSNECNYRCRTCGSDSSTSWYEEEKILFGMTGKPFPLRPYRDGAHFWDQIQALLPTVESVYLAGGEPSLMTDTYRLLDAFVEMRKFDVRIFLQTNFSNLTLHGRDLCSLLARFGDVTLSASLDGEGIRGEYLRKNQRWSDVLRNRERLAAACPNVKLALAPVLSIMNALHVPDFHWNWLQQGWVAPENLYLTLLLDPPEYRIQVLPDPFKQKALERYEKHIDDLRREFGEKSAQAQAHFQSAINYLREKDMSHLLGKFRERTLSLDSLRKENFAEVFPELAELMRA